MPRQKNQQKRAQENALPGIVPVTPEPFSLGAFERAEKLQAITGLNQTDLRNIASNLRRPNGDPWFPKPTLAKFDTVATLKGLFDLYKYRADRAKDMPVYSSMEAMSTATGISVTLLKDWKKAGCPAFRSRGDILLEDLLRWIEGWIIGNPESEAAELKAEGVADYEQMRTKYQARNEKVKNQELNDEVIKKPAAQETAAEIVGIMERMLQRFQSEYPTLLDGRDKKQIRSIVAADCKDVRANLRATLEKAASQKRHEAQSQPLAA
jgi:phage terminase Nu1 subunit (DNA packaging protein)